MEPVVLGRERVGAPRRARGAARGAAGPEPRDLVAERAGLGRARRGVGARARERVEVRVALGEERLEPRDLALRLGAGLGRLREAVAGEQRVLLLLLGVALRAVERGLGVGRGGAERGDLGLGPLSAAVGAVRVRGERVGGRRPVWKSKFYGAFALNHRVVLHAIDATPARPTHWSISTQPSTAPRRPWPSTGAR